MHRIATYLERANRWCATRLGPAWPLALDATLSIQPWFSGPQSLLNMPWYQAPYHNVERKKVYPTPTWRSLLKPANKGQSHTFFGPVHYFVCWHISALYHAWMHPVVTRWLYDVGSSVCMLCHGILAIVPFYTPKVAANLQTNTWQRALTWGRSPGTWSKRLVAWLISVMGLSLALLLQVGRPILALYFEGRRWAIHTAKGLWYAMRIIGGLWAYPLRVLAYGMYRAPGVTIALFYSVILATHAWPLLHWLFDACYPMGYVGTVLFGLSPIGCCYAIWLASLIYLGHKLFYHPIDAQQTLGHWLASLPLTRGDSGWFDHVLTLFFTIVWAVVLIASCRMLVEALTVPATAYALLQCFPCLFMGAMQVGLVFFAHYLWLRIAPMVFLLARGLGIRTQLQSTSRLVNGHLVSGQLDSTIESDGPTSSDSDDSLDEVPSLVLDH